MWPTWKGNHLEKVVPKVSLAGLFCWSPQHKTSEPIRVVWSQVYHVISCKCWRWVICLLLCDKYWSDWGRVLCTQEVTVRQEVREDTFRVWGPASIQAIWNIWKFCFWHSWPTGKSSTNRVLVACEKRNWSKMLRERRTHYDSLRKARQSKPKLRCSRANKIWKCVSRVRCHPHWAVFLEPHSRFAVPAAHAAHSLHNLLGADTKVAAHWDRITQSKICVCVRQVLIACYRDKTLPRIKYDYIEGTMTRVTFRSPLLGALCDGDESPKNFKPTFAFALRATGVGVSPCHPILTRSLRSIRGRRNFLGENCINFSCFLIMIYEPDALKLFFLHLFPPKTCSIYSAPDLNFYSLEQTRMFWAQQEQNLKTVMVIDWHRIHSSENETTQPFECWVSNQ